MRDDDTLVSCLCVTRNRVALLRRAVACFMEQTYEPRELVIQYESDDLATKRYVATLKDAAIRPVEVPASPPLRLGARRNRAVHDARGRYIAQWDDDDWYGPTRIAEQIAAIRSSGKRGCVLLRLVLYDVATQRAYVSGRRSWEGTLVAEKDAVPPFVDLGRGEDEPAVAKMGTADQLVALDQPGLYVYVYHGGNTSGRTHFKKRLVARAAPLGPEDEKRIRAALSSGAGTSIP